MTPLAMDTGEASLVACAVDHPSMDVSVMGEDDPRVMLGRPFAVLTFKVRDVTRIKSVLARLGCDAKDSEAVQQAVDAGCAARMKRFEL